MYTLLNALYKHLKFSKQLIIGDILQIVQCVTLVQEYLHASAEAGTILDYEEMVENFTL